ncbi:MAG: mechanosensitive ion channel family protein [Pseudomonadota bacterium]
MEPLEVELEAELQPLLDLFAGQPFIQSALVATLTLLLAKFISWALLGLFHRLTRLTNAQLDDVVVRALKTPLFYSILMVGFSIAVHLLPVSEKMQGVIIAILQSIGIFIWMQFAMRVSRAVLRSLAKDDKRLQFVQTQTLPLFENLAIIIVIAVALYLVFHAWSIDMSAWLASAGIVGIAVGFAAKDTLSNLFSGVFILADAPYKIGDYVVLDSGERGEITNIGIRSTRMLTRDDVELTIPNALMGNSKVINESGGPNLKYRIRIPVGVAYGSDIDQVQALLLEIANQDEQVCSDPEARVRFRAFGASSLDFELLCWVDRPDLRGLVTHHLLCAIYKRFNQEAVEIPYNKQDIYIKEMPSAS